MNAKLDKFYRDNQDVLENDFAEWVSYQEWGSGEDEISMNDEIFWGFVEDRMYEGERLKRARLLNAINKFPAWYKRTGWKIDAVIVIAVAAYFLKGAYGGY